MRTVSRYTGTARPPCFTRGYGLVFGNNERKALSMSITDRALRAKELDEPVVGPAQNPEFVLLHGDNDTVVNCKITERYCDSMKQQKNDCEYIPLPGAEHAFLLQGYRSKDEDVMRYMNMIDKFIEKRT